MHHLWKVERLKWTKSRKHCLTQTTANNGVRPGDHMPIESHYQLVDPHGLTIKGFSMGS
ncbi:hypothetical protein T05_4442 [Trichinella murrelli]|uniref:Uncharacterized protein n=1 Tax=Trichinella murrelli TaxID=144512 RepID=A0A0V0UCI9_9BILA|nr:hypothetical protein T05_4442 [Trichinella murrelli]